MICGCCGVSIDGFPTDIHQVFPQAGFEIPMSERRARVTRVGEDLCCIDSDTPAERLFLRCVLQIPIIYADKDIGLGLWVEMSAKDVERIVGELWEDSTAPPFAGTISASIIPGIPELNRVNVTVQLRGDDNQRPLLKATDDGELKKIQASGVTVPEWHAITKLWSGDAAKC